MIRSLSITAAALLALSGLFCPCARAEKSEQGRSETSVPLKLSFFDRYLLEAEFAPMGKNAPDHTLRSLRRAHIRLLRADRWFLDTVYEEELLWGFACEQINHTFDYFRAGRSFDDFAVFLFWNHTCYNGVHDIGTNHIHWNNMGFEITTDPDPGAWRDHDWHLRFRTARAFMLNDCEYRWMSQAHATLRQALPGGAAPFVRVSLDIVADPYSTTCLPTLEGGVTIPVGRNMLLEPFFRVIRRRDATGFRKGCDTWTMAGLRLVHRVDGERDEESEWETAGLFRLEVDAGYSVRLFQVNWGFVSNVAYRVVIPAGPNGGRTYFEVHTGINTPPEIMFPNYFTTTVGPSVEGFAGPFLWRLSYRYRERRAVGHHWEAAPFKCVHTVRLDAEVTNRPVAVRRINNNPDRLQGGGTLAVNPSRETYPYSIEAGGWAEVFLFRLDQTLFTLKAETTHFFGPDDQTLLGMALQLAMNIPGNAGDGRVYLRLEQSADPFRHGKGDQVFLGFDLFF